MGIQSLGIISIAGFIVLSILLVTHHSGFATTVTPYVFSIMSITVLYGFWKRKHEK